MISCRQISKVEATTGAFTEYRRLRTPAFFTTAAILFAVRRRRFKIWLTLPPNFRLPIELDMCGRVNSMKDWSRITSKFCGDMAANGSLLIGVFVWIVHPHWTLFA